MINVVEEFKSAATLLERNLVDPGAVAVALRNVARKIEEREDPVQLPQNIDIVWSQS